MTRDLEQVIPALKKYLDMNKLALGAVKPGGLFATFSCTGLVREDQFLDMLRRAGYYAGRTLQVLKVSGAGADHPFLANVPESRSEEHTSELQSLMRLSYAVFCFKHKKQRQI